MKFGVLFANVGTFVKPDGAVHLARTAEENGFESLWTVEHVVVPAGYESAYPYSSSGRMPGDETSPIPDPLVWLSYVAAETSTIRLGTGILILSQRNPVVTAKAVATLDLLSRGRVELGVGAGWLAEEFQAIGVPFEERGSRLDEAIGALRALWSEDEPTFHGRHFSFDRAISRPRPAQGTVPIHIGGHTPRAARRAGELGDGFFPGRGSVDDLERLIGTMRRHAEAAGRDADAIEVTAGGALDLDGVKRLADVGVDRVVIPPLAFDPEGVRAQLGRFADEVVAKSG